VLIMFAFGGNCYTFSRLQCWGPTLPTIPNLNANLSGDSQLSSSNSIICDKAEVHFFAGDWSGIDKLLPHVSTDAKKIKVMVMNLLLWQRQFTQSTDSKISMILSRRYCFAHRQAKLYFYVESLHFVKNI